MGGKRFSRWQLIAAAIGGALAALTAAALVAFFLLGPHALTLLQGFGVIRTRFVGDYDPTTAVDSALAGMVDGLDDRWSHYLTAEEYAVQNQRRSNSYVGIGVTVGFDDPRGLEILSVREGSPAAGAALKAGEVITAVDGQSIAGEARYQGDQTILGEEGTQVSLTVLSPDGAVQEISLTRAALETEPVSYELLDDGVGYVKLENFYSHSAEKLIAAVDSLMDQGAKSLVFDMRDNGGGYVGELTDMLDRLLPEGVIFRTQSRNGPEEKVESDSRCVEAPMAVLVNADTYSAAEFFAAELQEAAGSAVVGAETSGKGYSQQAIPLLGGGAMNLSTARYYTGNGISLIGTGVRLDAEVMLSKEKEAAFRAGTLPHADDEQLQKALELLKS
ncbi:MAG: S41 family peptidase [Pseudoflavonifractor sp.]|nr:S41 family peptidase [Pseudoflavonifractor sp.]